MAIHQHANGADVRESSPARRCFIAARPQADIRGIRRLLEERGITATASYERPWLGARPLDTIMALIEDADIVIAVLDDPSTSANSMFEVGFAFARDKKILVVAPRGKDQLPSNLDDTLYVRAEPSDLEAIGSNLDQLLAAPKPRRIPHLPAAPRTHAIGDEADRLLAEMRRALPSGDESVLEALVAEALQHSGVEIIQALHKRVSGLSPDFGIWSDDLESSVGNPLLIDVRASVRTTRTWRNVRQQLAANITGGKAKWGLLLYGIGPDESDDEFESVPPILVLSIERLIERLRVEGFAAIVSSLRDQAITVA